MKISLASARVNAELTQEEVCEVLKISKNTLVSYEAYRTKPDIDRAKELSNLYGCELDDIKWSKSE